MITAFLDCVCLVCAIEIFAMAVVARSKKYAVLSGTILGICIVKIAMLEFAKWN